ncbi:hypothetical protein [Methanolobus vulcani]|jgi:hypothetical protein|nr:hypothetical protein [Methanolobus vulcani]
MPKAELICRGSALTAVVMVLKRKKIKKTEQVLFRKSMKGHFIN